MTLVFITVNNIVLLQLISNRIKNRFCQNLCSFCKFLLLALTFNPIKDGGEESPPPTSFSHVTSTNVGIGP